MSSEPLPDSPEALAQGCLCPPGTNGNGAGVRDLETGRVYWLVDDDCPLHGYGAPTETRGLQE